MQSPIVGETATAIYDHQLATMEPVFSCVDKQKDLSGIACAASQRRGGNCSSIVGFTALRIGKIAEICLKSLKTPLKSSPLAIGVWRAGICLITQNGSLINQPKQSKLSLVIVGIIPA